MVVDLNIAKWVQVTCVNRSASKYTSAAQFGVVVRVGYVSDISTNMVIQGQDSLESSDSQLRRQICNVDYTSTGPSEQQIWLVRAEIPTYIYEIILQPDADCRLGVDAMARPRRLAEAVGITSTLAI